MIADACKRCEGLGWDGIEQLARIADPQGERPADFEVELSLLFAGDLAVHVLDLRLEHVAVDELARIRLRQVRRPRHLLFPSQVIRAHIVHVTPEDQPSSINSQR